VPLVTQDLETGIRSAIKKDNIYEYSKNINLNFVKDEQIRLLEKVNIKFRDSSTMTVKDYFSTESTDTELLFERDTKLSQDDYQIIDGKDLGVVFKKKKNEKLL